MPYPLLKVPRGASPELALAVRFLAPVCPLSIEQTGSAGAAARTYRVIGEDVNAYPYTVGLRGCSAINAQLLVVLVGLVSIDKLNR